MPRCGRKSARFPRNSCNPPATEHHHARNGALHRRHRQRAAGRDRGQRMRRRLHDPCAQSRPGRSEKAGLPEAQPDRPHPDADRPRGTRRQADHGHPVLGDPDVSVREDREIPAPGPGGAGPRLPVDGRRGRRLRVGQSDDLLPRRPHAGKGAGFGGQVLRGPLRQPVALRRRAARARRNIWPATRSPPPISRSIRSMPGARRCPTMPG